METFFQLSVPAQRAVYVAIALGVVGVGALVRWLLVRRAKAQSLHARLDHFSTALTLLTDTMETTLRDVVREVSRLSASPGVPESGGRRPDAKRRVRRAAKLARSVQEIAAEEQMSEGEVALMLQMSLEQTLERAGHAELR